MVGVLERVLHMLSLGKGTPILVDIRRVGQAAYASLEHRGECRTRIGVPLPSDGVSSELLQKERIAAGFRGDALPLILAEWRASERMDQLEGFRIGHRLEVHGHPRVPAALDQPAAPAMLSVVSFRSEEVGSTGSSRG